MANIINGTDTGSGGLITTGDSSDELQLQTAETTAVTIDSSQRVIIGGTTAVGSNLLTLTGSGGTGIDFYRTGTTAASGIITAYGSDDNPDARIRVGGTGNFIAFDTGAGSVTERVRITNDGLTFNGDTAAANALDDYEEGTFTFELYDATSGGNASPTTTTGRYTKIGNQVTVWFQGGLNNIDTTGMSAGAAIKFTLPFACSATSVGSGGSVTWDNMTFSTGRVMFNPIFGTTGAARGQFQESGSGVVDSNTLVNQITSGTTDLLRFMMTYQTD